MKKFLRLFPLACITKKERERERAMEQRLCEAAIKGSVKLLYEIIEEDELILDKIVEGCFHKSLLHVAASRGHLEFVKELLHRNPELAEVLDSRNRSALHLASAKGRIEIVKALITFNREMCLARDRDGRNPLHIAALKGKVEILNELFQANPHAARVKADRVQTILHLCVKHNQLNTLELLLEKIKGYDLVNDKDGCGNTILHLAVSGRQFEIIRLVLKNSKIDVNARNANGHTAMDILFLAQSGTDAKDLELNIKELLVEAKGKRAKDLVHVDWLTNKRDTLLIVASVIARMTFLAGVNPPGGVWQDDSNAHSAGEAVMAYNYSSLYPYFLRTNTVGFIASLSTIMLLMTELSFRRKAIMWALLVIMGMTITTMACTYAFSKVVITPKRDREIVSIIILVLVMVWILVIRLTEYTMTKLPSVAKAIKRIFKLCSGRPSSGQARTHLNSVSRSQANAKPPCLLCEFPLKNYHR